MHDYRTNSKNICTVVSYKVLPFKLQGLSRSDLSMLPGMKSLVLTPWKLLSVNFYLHKSVDNVISQSGPFFFRQTLIIVDSKCCVQKKMRPCHMRLPLLENVPI